MQLSIEPEEVGVLEEVLTQYLGDLRMEIGKTEDYATRQELHQRETVLRKVLTQLRQAGAGTRSSP